MVVLGDEPVVERAPIVDLWIRAARRNGAEVLTSTDDERVRSSDRVVLIWSGPGGDALPALAAELGIADKPGSAAFHLPETANGRGVADAWAAAGDVDPEDPEPIGLLIVSGDEAVANPDVRAMAEGAESVLAISMFRTPLIGWADLVLPGTSYLERDGTYVNLEGRLQRLRRAVIPPGPDELAWLAKLAERFDVELSPYPSQVFAEISAIAYGGLDYGLVGEHAPLPPPVELGKVQKPRRAKATVREGTPPDRLQAAVLRARPSSVCRSCISSGREPRSSSRQTMRVASASPTDSSCTSGRTAPRSSFARA